ncbi:MAG: DUF2914 domain-containing protein [Patescibacteria group bacterium]
MDIRSTRAFKFWEKYQHHLGVGAVIFGFLFDLEIAKRPDSIFNNLLLLSYLAMAGALIVVLNLRQTKRATEQGSYEPFFLLLALQFCFGGLAGNMLVLYGHSGTLVGNAMFLGLWVLLVLGNEYFRNRYTLLRLNVGMYYLLLLSYLLIAVPVFVTHSIGAWTFVLTGVISLICIGLFLTLLFFAVFRGRDIKSLRGVVYVVGAIFIAFNILYFSNAIPPVPLSLKDIAVYHSVLKTSDGNYVVLYEPHRWWEFWRDSAPTYTITAGSGAYCFSSVFAPSDLTTPVYHRWEAKNTATNQWETESRVVFSINGGRADGYRGYTTKASLTPGEWRCSVETGQGQLIGRVSFEVIISSTTPALSQKTL